MLIEPNAEQQEQELERHFQEEWLEPLKRFKTTKDQPVDRP